MKFQKWKKLILIVAICVFSAISMLVCLPFSVTASEAFPWENGGGTATITLTENTIYMISDPIVIPSGVTLTIEGSGVIVRTEESITANPNASMFTVEEGGTLKITGATVGAKAIIIDGREDNQNTTDASGPAILCKGTLDLDYVILRDFKNTNDTADYRGGAIATAAGDNKSPVDIDLDFCVINNCASPYGSAFYIRSNTGTIDLNNTLIYNCETGAGGGAIRSTVGTNLALSLNQCVIRDNTSANCAAGIFWNPNRSSTNAKLTITDCQFINLKTAESDHLYGAALYIGGGGAKSTDGTNVGGVEISGTGTSDTRTAAQTVLETPPTEIVGTLFQECSAGRGGAIDVRWTLTSGASIDVSISGNVLFQKNKAIHGGALSAYLINNGTQIADQDIHISISDGVIFDSNSSMTTGGTILLDNKTATTESSPTINLDFTDSTITNSTTGQSGGGIRLINSNFTMDGGTISNSSAGFSGGGVCVSPGGIFTAKGGATISGCSSSENTDKAYDGGGAVYVVDGTFIMESAVLQNNKSVLRGGGVFIYCNDSNPPPIFSMSGGEIHDNTANYGGGVYIATNGQFDLTGGSIHDNTAEVSGGGIYTYQGTVTMENAVLADNKISETTGNDRGGGGIYIYEGTFKLKSGTISGNRSTSGGGGVYVTQAESETTNVLGNFIMEDGTISNNSALNNGGGVYMLYLSEFVMTGGSITDNSVDKGNGGAVYVNEGASFLFANGTLSNNTAIKSGGAVSIRNGIFNMNGGTISGNKLTATNLTEYGGGAAIGVYGDRNNQVMNVRIHGGTISNNQSSLYGGAIGVQVPGENTHINLIIGCEECCGNQNGQTITCDTNTTATLHTCPVITGNTAGTDGGGLYLNAEGAGSSAILTLYCGSIEKNAAKNASSRNVIQKGGEIRLYGLNIGNDTDLGVTLIGGDFTKYTYDETGKTWTQVEKISVCYWLTWDPNNPTLTTNATYYTSSISSGVKLNLPSYTNTDGKAAVAWRKGTPTAESFDYVGAVYTVTVETHLYAVYPGEGHGDVVDETISAGADYTFHPTETTVQISADSTLTVAFEVKNMTPSYYENDSFVLSFQNQTQNSIIPANGSTIVMVVQIYETETTAPITNKYYYYNFTEDNKNEINLTDFIKMGTSDTFYDRSQIIADCTNESIYTEKFLFIVDFNNQLDANATASGNIKLDCYPAVDTSGDKVSQSALYTLCAKGSFEITIDATSPEVDAPFTLEYSISDSDCIDTNYDGKYTSLVLSAENGFPVDSKINVNGTEYALMSNGKFIIPFENVSNSLQLVSKNTDAIVDISAELWISDVARKPYSGTKVASTTFTLQAKTLPALKISMAEQIFHLDGLNSIAITVNSENIGGESGNTITWSVQKKENGGYEEPMSISVEDNKLVFDGRPVMGTYRVVATVQNKDTVLLTVPCNFIILE